MGRSGLRRKEARATEGSKGSQGGMEVLECRFGVIIPYLCVIIRTGWDYLKSLILPTFIPPFQNDQGRV